MVILFCWSQRSKITTPSCLFTTLFSHFPIKRRFKTIICLTVALFLPIPWSPLPFLALTRTRWHFHFSISLFIQLTGEKDCSAMGRISFSVTVFGGEGGMLPGRQRDESNSPRQIAPLPFPLSFLLQKFKNNKLFCFGISLKQAIQVHTIAVRAWFGENTRISQGHLLFQCLFLETIFLFWHYHKV